MNQVRKVQLLKLQMEKREKFIFIVLVVKHQKQHLI